MSLLPLPQTAAKHGQAPARAGRIDLLADLLADWMARGSNWRVRAPLVACLIMDMFWGFWFTLAAALTGIGGFAIHDGLEWVFEKIDEKGWSRWPITAFRAWGRAQSWVVGLLPASWGKGRGSWPGLCRGVGVAMAIALLCLGGVWISWCVSMGVGRALAKRPELAPAVLGSGRNPLLVWRLGAVKWPDLNPWFMESPTMELLEAPDGLRRYALLRPSIGDVFCLDAIGWRRIHESKMRGQLPEDWLAQALGDAESIELAKSVPVVARSASAKRI